MENNEHFKRAKRLLADLQTEKTTLTQRDIEQVRTNSNEECN